jgi:putative endonuclease
MAERAYVYILASKPNGTLYIGVTGNLPVRVEQHKAGAVPGFTAKYKVDRLVWFEGFADVRDAIDREKAMKKWYRKWKIELIEKSNPSWEELQPW